jgi:hypothetical protein
MIITAHNTEDISRIEEQTQKFFVGWLAVEGCYCVPVFTRMSLTEAERREKVLALNGRVEGSMKPTLS